METDEGGAEFERLAQTAGAADVQLASEHPSNETISRWQASFRYSSNDAVQLIGAQQNDGEAPLSIVALCISMKSKLTFATQ